MSNHLEVRELLNHHVQICKCPVSLSTSMPVIQINILSTIPDFSSSTDSISWNTEWPLFYANIIQANHQAFFPRTKINFFTVFISWLNLDLGIETCFYDGIDIYAYSWFQFLFPFYVWFLVGCIILACRYSQSIAKRFGQNPVAVLATLLLMSYSKILQTIIVPLSWTYLV